MFTGANYFLTDRLGSVDAVTDGNGNLIETRGYDAFGAPRTGTWADAVQLASTAITPKGFTSHEHLNSLKLIHMNGRMYDYQLGRFLGVDPFIQMPTNSQSLNPYSYIMNNPLSGTDPMGYAAIQCGGRRNCDGVNNVFQGGSEMLQKDLGGVTFGGNRVVMSSATARAYGSKANGAKGQSVADAKTSNEKSGAISALQTAPMTGSGDGDGISSVPESIQIEDSGFKTLRAAAKALGKKRGEEGVTRRQELQSALVKIAEDNFGYLTPGWGPVGAKQIDNKSLFAAYQAASKKGGFMLVAWMHGHWDNQSNFSPLDFDMSWGEGKSAYLVNKKAEVRILTNQHLKDALKNMHGSTLSKDLSGLKSYYSTNDSGLPGDTL